LDNFNILKILRKNLLRESPAGGRIAGVESITIGGGALLVGSLIAGLVFGGDKVVEKGFIPVNAVLDAGGENVNFSGGAGKSLGGGGDGAEEFFDGGNEADDGIGGVD
jgi:hypothetical protein